MQHKFETRKLSIVYMVHAFYVLRLVSTKNSVRCSFSFRSVHKLNAWTIFWHALLLFFFSCMWNIRHLFPLIQFVSLGTVSCQLHAQFLHWNVNYILSSERKRFVSSFRKTQKIIMFCYNRSCNCPRCWAQRWPKTGEMSSCTVNVENYAISPNRIFRAIDKILNLWVNTKPAPT